MPQQTLAKPAEPRAMCPPMERVTMNMHDARYRILRPLAQGGMASVCVAETTSGEQVALKRMAPGLLHDAGMRGLFADEGALCAQLQHRSIAALLDQGEDVDGPFLVFELVEGTDLSVVLAACAAEGRGLDDATVVALAMDILEGLVAAHGATDADGVPLGVVHRDLSPGNVLLSEDGQVKLCDFGVAASVVKTTHTVAGEMKGKFAYMAPEQTRGEDVDARADLFALGVILAECARGKPLFDAPTDADVVHAVRTAAPPAPADYPGTAPGVVAFITQLLEKQAADRFLSAQDALDALDDLAFETGAFDHRRRLLRALCAAHPREPAALSSGETTRRQTQRVMGPVAPAVPVTASGPRKTRWAAAAAAALGLGAAGWALAPGGQRGGTGPAAPTVGAPADPAETGMSAALPVTPAPAQSTLRAAPAAPRPQLEAPRRTTRTVAKPVVRPTRPGPPGRAPVRRGAKKPAAPQSSARPGKAAGKDVPAAKPGMLYLSSEPWAKVRIDGKPVGTTPLFGRALPAGTHTIVLENPVFHIERTLNVTITPGGTFKRFVDLTSAE